LSALFRICHRFLAKLSPLLESSRNELYTQYTLHRLDFFTGRDHFFLLDVGGYDGRLTHKSCEKLTNMGFNVNAIILDLDSKALHSGKRQHKSFDYVCADANHLPFQDCVFDLVSAYSFFEHLDDPQIAINEIALVSKGDCIVQIPNMHYFIEPHTKFPLLFIFPTFAKKKIAETLGVSGTLNFKVLPVTLTVWFKQASFDLIGASKIYHAKWSRLFGLPQGYLLNYESAKITCKNN